ncbi:hypothetical protein LWI28_001238 [Acer negundo]|uniref:Uncharacterized protein n=1 Tax=Acer negundo TaxID=4023 RepID=A0AAD5JFN9_ACENE|nr:hypothetical protein LWI28_001238 [Acer negundo]KAK4859039.1 hypothetical protein QYF36_025796 [Acer negundo]
MRVYIHFQSPCKCCVVEGETAVLTHFKKKTAKQQSTVDLSFWMQTCLIVSINNIEGSFLCKAQNILILIGIL